MELPEAVRRRVVEVAADRLGVMEAADIPASLRPFAKFAPGRRRQVVLPVAAALETDDDFRAKVAEGVREGLPDLVAALDAGSPLSAADPDDVAAVAYLLRSDGWEEHVRRAADRELAAREAAETERAERTAAAAQRHVDAELVALRREVESALARAEQAVADAERERQRARSAVERARRAEAALTEATAAISEERESWARDDAVHAAEMTRLREQLVETETQLERLRRDTRDTRDAAEARRWLLLDTLARAVSGLREELAPAPPTRRPADFVAAASPTSIADPSPDEPSSVDMLLALPNAHLVVDGYNVTKTGYPDLPLADQRTRLVAGLAALASRTGAEMTCVFDGAEVVVPIPTAAARRVRVRFSPAGQTADELIRRLVRAEPPGRPVVVCSADNEVIDGVRRAGARIVSPTALLTRLTAR